MIILTVKIKPLAKYKTDFINAFHNIKNEVYAEQGCLEYELHQNTKNSEELFIFERWSSKQDQENHMTTPHMIKFFEKINPWFNQEPQMDFYDIKSTQE